MEAFLAKLGDAIFTQSGTVGALLAAAVLWLARQLSIEKADHKITRDRLFELTEKSIEGDAKTSGVLQALQSTVERLLTFRQGRDG